MPPIIAPAVLNNALEAVGNTPVIRLGKIAQEEGLRCNLLAKVEFFSAGGSVKDRIAKRMVEAAEKDGVLVPGKSVIIEPTSGNTGIGLALAGAIKGYSVIITLPDKVGTSERKCRNIAVYSLAKMSLEKEATLRALGAEVVRTPTAAAWDSEESHIGVAKKLQRNIPHAVILDQYSNPHNPLAHEHGTGPEIVAAVQTLDGSSRKVDAFVAGAGTGGTITGVSRCLKGAHNSDCVVVAVDPKGSILAIPDSLNDDGRGGQYVVEGIGYDFVPEVLDRESPHVDLWIKTDDKEAFAAAHRLMRTEGLLVGGSSGTALAGALRYLKSEDGWKRFGDVEGKNVVVLLPDGVRNYMGKPWFLDATLKGPATPLAETISKVLHS